MMKHKIKYRVVGADRSKKKYAINLDEGSAFIIPKELLEGMPIREGSHPLCSLVIKNNVLWIQAAHPDEPLLFNGKQCTEAEVRPGDLIQLAGFSLEFLECPHTVRNTSNATQFLDVSEMFPPLEPDSSARNSLNKSASTTPPAVQETTEPAPASQEPFSHETSSSPTVSGNEKPSPSFDQEPIGNRELTSTSLAKEPTQDKIDASDLPPSLELDQQDQDKPRDSTPSFVEPKKETASEITDGTGSGFERTLPENTRSVELSTESAETPWEEPRSPESTPETSSQEAPSFEPAPQETHPKSRSQRNTESSHPDSRNEEKTRSRPDFHVENHDRHEPHQTEHQAAFESRRNQSSGFQSPVRHASNPGHESRFGGHSDFSETRSRPPRAESRSRFQERRPHTPSQSPRSHARKPQEHWDETDHGYRNQNGFGHWAMSLGIAAAGSACTARVLVSSSKTPEGMLVLCAALAAIPLVLLASWGLFKLNPHLKTSATHAEYGRFLGWTLLCSIPWAYSVGASFPLALFATLIMSVLVIFAFMARFRPDTQSFLPLGAGCSVLILGALGATHYYKLLPGERKAEPLAEQSLQDTSDTAVAQVAHPVTQSAPVAPPPAPASASAAQNATDVAAAPVSPTRPTALQPQTPQQPARVALQDSIPSIPAQNTTVSRAPANEQALSRTVIDPLAHDEFFQAIRVGNLRVVRDLLNRKVVSSDFTLDKGNTPLIVAAQSGHLNIVKYLIRRRVNLNAQDPHGTTALMWAAFRGHRSVVEYLVKMGADTKVLRDDGDTALDIARKWGKTDIARILEGKSGRRVPASSRHHHTSQRRHYRH